MKYYLDLKPNSSNEETSLEISTGYEAGGYNYFNGTSSERGYYLYVLPCNISIHTASNGQQFTSVQQTVGKGGKLLLKAVKRRSKKAEEEAESLAAEKADYLVNHVCVRYGLTERYKYLRECEDFEALKKDLTPEILDIIESEIADYNSLDRESFESKYADLPRSVCWYESMITTNCFVSELKASEEE